MSKGINRLNENEIINAREQRLKEIQMWAVIKEFLTYFIFAILMCMITFTSREQNSFFQVKHLRTYFYNTRQINADYTQVCSLFFKIIFLSIQLNI